MIWLSEVLSGLLFESDVVDLRSTRERDIGRWAECLMLLFKTCPRII